MTVLVTRPGLEGQALCQQLVDDGITAIHHPLIRIVDNSPSEPLSDLLQTSDIIIAVSQHAVTSAQRILAQSDQSWPSSALYLGVGQKTAHILSKACKQKVNYPQVSDSEHLLKLPELTNVQDKTILILRGNGGRELIRESLINQGARVSYCETYRREYIPINHHNTYPQWVEQKISKIVITSQEQLEYFTSDVPAEYSTWLFTRHLFVPSQRIAERAHQLGYSTVTNTTSATNPILLAALQP
ncbi:uroporphyrinogen-III synthase [Vibrio sp. D404a]|uniref:uroporphyrinogen-III synthase n=1 Tax=unclassified Vibrio TaxID=2614977 RepID=UPI00255558B4|nr:MULTISPECIES: uroporphyrinogen-III synthase [unclassified Vibrio]MDK9738329.1 uroporphyrinogen-III synthase [Vibrio sp. D404a]MDK9798842.1 uroporphyrinogen-III synthase [Vibrio sp. D449a]